MLLDIRSFIIIGAMIAAFLAAGAVGTKIGHTMGVAESAEMASENAATILRLTNEKSDLQRELDANNTAIAVAEAKSSAAIQAQALAEQHARDLSLISAQRMKELDKVLRTAITASEVLDRYWDMRK